MSKEYLRKKIINLRRVNYIDHSIIFFYFKKVLKKLNSKNVINVGGYYPINSEIECFGILYNLDKKKFKISLPVIKKKIKWIFTNGLSTTH